MYTVQAIGLDRVEDQYEMTLQYLLPGAGTEQAPEDSVQIIKGHGKTVAAALQQATMAAPRELFLGQLQILLLGEGVLQAQVSDAISYLLEENDLRLTTWLLAVPGSAAQVMEQYPDVGKTDIYYLMDLIRDQNRRVTHSVQTVNDYLVGQQRLGNSSVLTAVKIRSDGALSLDGAALLYQDTLQTWVDQDWMNGYVWLVGSIHAGVLEVKQHLDADAILALQVQNSQCKERLIEMQTDGAPRIVLEIPATLEQIEGSGWRNRDSEEQIARIQSDAVRSIRQQVEHTIQIAQKQNCDVLGLEQWFAARHPYLWNQTQVHWKKGQQSFFQNMRIEIAPKCLIR